jgi:ribosomal protein S18 acetylase RimI-like enzyme
MTTVHPVNTDADIGEIRALFLEYAQSLGIDLAFQDFEAEITGLPGAYSPPHGCLLLATADGRSAGCVAVRDLQAGLCEMKRLYVKPEARGQGVGRALAEAAIRFGRASGYEAMRLDTLPNMVAAQALYRQLGFREIPAYRYNPIPGTTFLELALRTTPCT